MLDAFAAATQALMYAGVLCASGAVLAASTLHTRGDAARALARTARWGAILTILMTAVGTAILVLRLGNDLDPTILAAVLATNVGAAAALRIGGATLLLILPALHEDSFGRGLHLSAAALVVASFAYSGHAATEGIASGLIAALHVAIAAWWVGSLIAMVGVDDAAQLVRRFSSLAVVLIAGLVVAGAILIFALLDFSAFAITPYVRNLIIKIGLAACVFAIAAYNKFLLTSRVLAGEAAARVLLRRAIRIELALIGLVLIATAILTTYSSPSD